MTPCMTSWPQPALTILPLLMQPVQTYIRFGVLPTRAFTRWMFGFQRRLVRRWECDTFIPQLGPLPHTSHTAAMMVSSSTRSNELGDATSGRVWSTLPEEGLPLVCRRAHIGTVQPRGLAQHSDHVSRHHEGARRGDQPAE